MTYRQAGGIALFTGECEGETHIGEGGEWVREGGRSHAVVPEVIGRDGC